jgi:transcriptional regulator with XRE-family HTH domain
MNEETVQGAGEHIDENKKRLLDRLSAVNSLQQGRIIRRIRTLIGWAQGAVAKTMGMHQSHLSLLEKGKRAKALSADQLSAFCASVQNSVSAAMSWENVWDALLAVSADAQADDAVAAPAPRNDRYDMNRFSRKKADAALRVSQRDFLCRGDLHNVLICESLLEGNYPYLEWAHIFWGQGHWAAALSAYKKSGDQEAFSRCRTESIARLRQQMAAAESRNTDADMAALEVLLKTNFHFMEADGILADVRCCTLQLPYMLERELLRSKTQHENDHLREAFLLLGEICAETGLFTLSGSIFQLARSAFPPERQTICGTAALRRSEAVLSLRPDDWQQREEALWWLRQAESAFRGAKVLQGMEKVAGAYRSLGFEGSAERCDEAALSWAAA